MIAYYTTEIEVEIQHRPQRPKQHVFEYRLYTIDAEVVVNDEWCELRSVTGASLQLDSGEEITIAVDELPEAALESLRSELSDTDTRRGIYDRACAVDADLEDDRQRRIADERRHREGERT